MVMILVVEIIVTLVEGMEMIDQDKLAERFPASASFLNSSL